MHKKLRSRIDNFLYKKGIIAPTIRHLLCTQIILTVAGLVIGIFTVFFTWYPLLFGIGSVLASYNFWHIAFFVQGAIGAGYSKAAAVKMVFGFTFRLLLTGVVLFFLIIWWHLPVLPIMLGLTSTIAGVIYWAAARAPAKPAKEA